VRGGFSLTSSSDKPFALDAVRGASRLFSQALSFVGQVLILGCGLFERAALLHGGSSVGEGGSATGVLITDKCHRTVR
jgi:hypothetical protein